MKFYGRKKVVGGGTGMVKLVVGRKDTGLAASLRKVFGDKVRIRAHHASGSVLDFPDGQSMVLLGSDTVTSKVKVTQTSPRRFEVAMEAPGEVEVGDAEATFLSMKLAALGQGKLRLTPPLSRADWHRSFGQLIASISREAEAAKRTLFEET